MPVAASHCSKNNSALLLLHIAAHKRRKVELFRRHCPASGHHFGPRGLAKSAITMIRGEVPPALSLHTSVGCVGDRTDKQNCALYTNLSWRCRTKSAVSGSVFLSRSPGVVASRNRSSTKRLRNSFWRWPQSTRNS